MGAVAALPPIRSIALGTGAPAGQLPVATAHAARVLRDAEIAFHEAGYEVQTVRLATRPLLGDPGAAPAALLASAAQLQAVLADHGLGIASIGPVDASARDFDPAALDVVAEIVLANPSLYASALIARPEHPARREVAEHVAATVLRLARDSEGGLATFRFAATACMPPGSPFFPAGYHEGPDALTVGWQGASVVTDVARAGGPATTADDLRVALEAAAQPIVTIARRVAEEAGIAFGGIDLSPAPMGGDSIGAALELLSGVPVGAPGTMAAAATITTALRTAHLPLAGYSGLMLPVMEDDVLAARWASGSLGFQQLLAWSAVCGTGLDAVPLPGDVDRDGMARLFLDVAALAVRLGKPLSARLMPVPGRAAGEMTSFDSPYLVETRLRPLDS
jgi:uncharacterized protein (UPF0210 family)